MDKAQEKGKPAEVPDVPLLADTPYQRQMRQRVIINLKPVIERLDAQGEILCSLQSDVNSIFMSEASTSKELSQVKNVVRSEVDVPRPSGPDEQVAGPSGPAAASPQAEVNGSGPSGPDEQVSGPSGQAEVSGPSGPLESESVQHIAEEAEAIAPEPPAPSSTQTSVPSSSTAPPAPQTFKKPQPRTISSPTPFPSQSTSSPASSTPISPPPPIFEVPPVSSSAGASSSSGPPSSGPSDIPPTTSHSLLHPSPPPSFITVIPEGAQLESPYLGKIKDEFEEVILRSVLKVWDHIHRADSSSSAPKKRKISSTSSLSSEPLHPPLWFSLTVDNKNKPMYREYLQKVVFATLVNLPFLNLSDHLNVILPYTPLSKTEKSKIFSIAHSKTEEQWARGHRELYKKFVLAKSARFITSIVGPHSFRRRSRWPGISNSSTTIDMSIDSLRSNSANLSSALGSTDAHTEAIQVDFATLQVPEEILLPPIHSLVMDSSIGSIIFEHFARVMGRIKVQKGFQVAFHRFLFREYHQGHVSVEVLAPILSECERLTPSDWARFYPLSAQQLSVLNECQAREGHPLVSKATFLDMNSIHLVQDPFRIWVERYKVYVALCQELKAKQNFYPISVDLFLARASFGSVSFKRISLSREAYANFLDEQLALHLKRMAPSMGPKYTLSHGVFC
ncbi:hypothetical protein Taro_053464 [Colocasia esculenta]|uniref:Uncharacterized protein n=1 Tax=Colocasia esculenta TaxID=4460 RepID=A0A843XL81_COLES|nr:hypothetical protein [Colocasia esculenta]